MREISTRIDCSIYRKLLAALCLYLLAACGSTPEPLDTTPETTPAWSISRAVNTDHSMISLLDPTDIVHHQAEPPNWFLHDFAIKDDLQTGRFSAVLTERSGPFNVRVTFGELTDVERAAAGPEAKMRLRVINHRLLLSGGDAWPSTDTDYRRFAHDSRWIGIPNGDYGVIITRIKPGAAASDIVFQLIRVNDMSVVKHAPGIPQLIYGEKAAVVGVNSTGFEFSEQCLDVPGEANWAPLSSREMPLPGAKQVMELPRSMHKWALAQQEAGNNASVPVVLSRNPEVGSFGFFIKPSVWKKSQLPASGEAKVATLVRCAVQITDVVATPDQFSLRVKAIPTAQDRLPTQSRRSLENAFDEWLRATNDPAWRFKIAKVQKSRTDAAMVLGILDYLNLSSKESEKMLTMSNALRVDYLLDRLEQF